LRWKIQSARAEKRNQMIKSTNDGKLLGPQLVPDFWDALCAENRSQKAKSRRSGQ